MAKVWFDGEIKEDSEVTLSLFTHALHYGSSWFEGVRAYPYEDGGAVFRLREHIKRLLNSCKIYKTAVPYNLETIMQACIDTLKANGFKGGYIRPIVFRGGDSLGVDPHPNPVHVAVLVMNWGAYLGEEALAKGIKVMVSSWRRPAPDTLPMLAKAGGNYLNSQLIHCEATDNGYDEGIGLDVTGNVSEGSGENLFLVRDGVLWTPPLGASALGGITRDSVIQIARYLGIDVIEQIVPREMLYLADEVFFSGTAAEVTPIASIDQLVVGSGRRGPVTEQIQKTFFAIAHGQNKDFSDWLTVY